MDSGRYDRRSQGCSEAEWQTRLDLAAAHRWLELNGWSDLIFNHLTARVPQEPNAFLIKPHALTFGEVTASNLIKAPLHGERPSDVNRAGFAIHSVVLKARPEINAVMHVHSAAGLAISASKRGLRFLSQESMKFYDRISYHDFTGILLDNADRARLAQDLGRNKAMIMRNHGLLTCAATIAEAAIAMHDLIVVADAQLRVEATGAELNEPDRQVCEKTAALYDTIIAEGGCRDEWQAVLRQLARLASDYRS
jgi:ribulose-5-phosphate 4-epimerase/fuculose-1-phosphate aldolase